ncbi:flagellar basal-body rod protein FlgG [Poriferisphaera sp. WC338]|uniref:flagellar basal-body rod protein FlgG n=1 Tax=Poriferisphaera sp. WC338 TaxID=3425129 RepID=UPI003D8184AE
MAILALHSASSGLSSLSTKLDVVANNLANMNTGGFKASRVNFEDLLYQQKAQPGVENAAGTTRPHGIQVGLGTRVSGTQIDFTKGQPTADTGKFAVAIDGEGFFRVKIVDGLSRDGFGYTRSGNFVLNSERELVLGTSEGPRLEPPVQVPDEYDSVEIKPTGQVVFRNQNGVEVGSAEIQMFQFPNASGVKQIGGNIYVETDASGATFEGTPGEGSFGKLLHGFLEGSNVNPTNELIDLITTQRAFELNSQTIQAADETLQVISNLRR